METSKKIKLVTFAPHPNFGTCLQSYALNKVLRDMGHDVEFIYNGRETPPLPFKYYVLAVLNRLVHFKKIRVWITRKQLSLVTDITNSVYILKLPNNYLLYWLSFMPHYNKVYKLFKCRTLQWKKVHSFTFEDGNYKMKRLYIRKQYNEVVEDADLFITGSDQIWNPYCGGFNPMMFLEFAGSKKRIAYSSSIARPHFPREIELRVKEDLSKFQHIAVREQSSVSLLSELLGRDDIHLVVDPTYLLNKDEWMDFGKRAKIEFQLPKEYIFCYFVGGDRVEEYEAMVEDVKIRTGIRDVITLECYNRDFNYGKGTLYKDAGPYEWVYLLSHASMVCMDSFHATVFALKFHKNFVHILKTKGESSELSQNARMYDILKRYGLDFKFYNQDSNEWLNSVDYVKIQNIMDKEISDSLKILQHEINN